MGRPKKITQTQETKTFESGGALPAANFLQVLGDMTPQAATLTTNAPTLFPISKDSLPNGFAPFGGSGLGAAPNNGFYAPFNQRKTNLPPIFPKRDNLGLLEHIEYIYKPDGLIDWLKLAPEGSIYVKPGKEAAIEKQYGKPWTELSLNEIDEKYLAISVAGLRVLSKLKGFSSLTYRVDVATPDYAAVTVQIRWLGDYSSQNREITTENVGTAFPPTANKMTINYLVETAANRAEARAIRFGLGLSNIVSREELIGTNEPQNDDSLAIKSANPIDTFNVAKIKIKEAGFDTWGQFNNALLASGIVTYKDKEDIMTVDRSEMMTIISYANKLKNGEKIK